MVGAYLELEFISLLGFRLNDLLRELYSEEISSVCESGDGSRLEFW